MKIKDIFNIKNISNYIEGNSKYFYDKLIGLPQHTREEIVWRLEQCKDDCVKTGKCKFCGCTTKGKVFVKESCNKGERFPDLRTKEEWEEFKKTINEDI